jgi:hypothetical protein
LSDVPTLPLATTHCPVLPSKSPKPQSRDIIEESGTVMPFVPAVFVHQRALNSAIQIVEYEFASQVVYIRHSFGEDASGAPSVFFRVLVRDEMAPIVHLREFAQQVSIALMDAARTDENGLHAYFDFRSVAEQARLHDPDWE